MKFLVVLFIISAVKGSLISYNVPIVAHSIPAAVSHQSRIDLHSSPIITPLVSHAWAPAISTHSLTPSIWTGQGLGHLLKKRSLVLAAPIASVAHTVVAPAVSHQSRYDITTTAGHIPLAHSSIWSAPIGHGLGSSWGLGHLLRKRSLVAPLIGHSAISTAVLGQSTTISKQSLDIVHPTTIHAAPVIAHSPIIAHSAPIISHSVIPLAHSIWSNPIGLGHGHLLKKRSLVSPLIGHSLISTPIIGQSTSISKQSLDIIHPTTIYAHSAPILAHSAPILAHSAPILAHSAPIISSLSSPWAHSGLSHLGQW